MVPHAPPVDGRRLGLHMQRHGAPGVRRRADRPARRLPALGVTLYKLQAREPGYDPQRPVSGPAMWRVHVPLRIPQSLEEALEVAAMLRERDGLDWTPTRL